MKLKELLESRETLDKLSNSTNLKAKVAYRIGKLCKQLNDEIKLFDEQRNKLIQQYSDGKNEDGADVVTDSNKIKIVQEQIAELLEEEISDDIQKINISDLDEVGLSPVELMSIDYILADD